VSIESVLYQSVDVEVHSTRLAVDGFSSMKIRANTSMNVGGSARMIGQAKLSFMKLLEWIEREMDRR
jgi:hypothetical protein